MNIAVCLVFQTGMCHFLLRPQPVMVASVKVCLSGGDVVCGYVGYLLWRNRRATATSAPHTVLTDLPALVLCLQLFYATHCVCILYALMLYVRW